MPEPGCRTPPRAGGGVLLRPAAPIDECDTRIPFHSPSRPLGGPSLPSSPDPSLTFRGEPGVTAPLEGLLAGLRLGLGTEAGRAGRPEADAEALSRVADWNAVASLARRHQVESLLLRGMRTRPGLRCVSHVEPGLERARGRNVRRGFAQIDGLQRAAGLLRAAGVPFLVLKGMSLSQRLYGNPLERAARDIDLLASPHAFQAAERVLLENGWRRLQPSFPETPSRNRWYRRFRHEHELVGPGGPLELHRRLSHNPFYFDVPFENLHAGSVPVEIGALSFRVLGEEDELAYLMCHGARHYWSRLKWLCDVAVILASLEPQGLERIAVRCRQDGLESILASTLRLCREALHVRVPPGPPPLPAGGRRAACIVGFSRRTWGDVEPTGSRGGFDWLGQKVVGLLAKPDPRTVGYEIASVAIGPRDWGRLDLPDRLFYLYFPLRPFLWLSRRNDGRKRPPAPPAPLAEREGGAFRFRGLLKALRTFLRAPAEARVMAVEAALCLLLARVLVKYVTMNRWRRWLTTREEPMPAGRPSAGSHAALPPADPERREAVGEPLPDAPVRFSRRTARIVRRVAHHVPFPAVCLPQAMALQWMLRRRGIGSRLIFGARRTAGSANLDFHAWLTVGGKCVIGGGELETYSELPPFDGIEQQPG